MTNEPNILGTVFFKKRGTVVFQQFCYFHHGLIKQLQTSHKRSNENKVRLLEQFDKVFVHSGSALAKHNHFFYKKRRISQLFLREFCYRIYYRIHSAQILAQCTCAILSSCRFGELR